MWSEKDQLLSHKAIPAVGKSRQSSWQAGRPRALPVKPKLDWGNVEGLMKLALKGNSKFQYLNEYV